MMPDENLSEEKDVHLHIHLDALTINVVHTVSADAALKSMFQSLIEDFAKMSNTVQQAIDALTADVAQETTVNQSAIALIQGVPALITAAIAAASAAGATPAQLAAFDALNTSLAVNTSALAAAVTAGTPVNSPAA
jgi:hypothetical protein